MNISLSKQLICTVIALCLVATGLFVIDHVSYAQTQNSSDNYIISSEVISVGGATSGSSSNYSILDTIGETFAYSATSTSASYGLKAGFHELYPDGYLTLSVGSSSINFGTLSTGSTATDSHTLTVDTNAGNGYSVTVSGATLTSGSDTIDAIGVAGAASSAGSEQFGINVVANTTPTIGADPTGSSPIGSAASPYDTADSFAYSSGDTIASAASQVNETTFTISYIVNIAGATEGGDYSTTLTYSAVGNF